HAVCQGEIVGTWTYDKDGLKRGGPAIPESAENEYFYRTPMIRFHVAPEGDRLVMNSVFGSKAASGNIYRVEQLGEHPMLVPGGPGWRA
ncbi:MAG: hypothetical protein JO317_02610, partial [Verrucomicrobiae bacterium]|nr:hypothetical protein [Verrucomicrobiae bacterium]